MDTKDDRKIDEQFKKLFFNEDEMKRLLNASNNKSSTTVSSSSSSSFKSEAPSSGKKRDKFKKIIKGVTENVTPFVSDEQKLHIPVQYDDIKKLIDKNLKIEDPHHALASSSSK